MISDSKSKNINIIGEKTEFKECSPDSNIVRIPCRRPQNGDIIVIQEKVFVIDNIIYKDKE